MAKHVTSAWGKKHQTGVTEKWKDKLYTAKPTGWRKSKGGNYYYENRANRSDLNPKKKL